MSLRAAIDALLAPYDHSDTPGVVVGVARAGATVYRRAFGMANLESGVANTPGTRMPVGSVTKQFTCLAALLLAEDGRLDVDASIRAYLPELPVLAGEPTLRQLMMHTGGYRCHLDIGFADGFAMKPVGSALAALVRQTGVNFPPGAGQCYCNGGYHLLSLAMERAGGLPFEAILEERIFRPLGLRDTESIRDDHGIRRGLATPYVPLPGGGWRQGVNVSEERLGDGSMVSTVDDMLSWLAYLRRPMGAGRPSRLQEMTAPARLANGYTSEYGLGLRATLYRGLRTVGHGGGVMGATSHVVTVPESEVDVVVMSNTTAPAASLALRVLDAALAEAPLPPLPPPPRAAEYTPLLGTYSSPESGRVIGLHNREGALSLSFLGSPPAPLETFEPLGHLPFRAPTAAGHLLFDIADQPGKETVECVRVSEGGQTELYRRLSASAPAPAAVVCEAGGRYSCEDIEAVVELTVVNGGITLECSGPYGRNSLLLEPVAPDLLLARHELMPFAAAVRLARLGGTVAGLTVTTGRTRALPFVRVGRT